ncbi:MAG TPA: M28 family peptidase [Kofleriaceae bacterium]|nr:M28 family peptidase [Kofleriaceae bacterium]
MRRAGVALVVAALGCGGEDGGRVAPDPAAVAGRLEATLEALADLGDKRAGTPGGMAAGDMLLERFQAAGLEDVRAESFEFPGFALAGSSLEVSVDGGAPDEIAHDVFYYSGSGAVEAELVDLGNGMPDDYDGVDVDGKICLVVRDARYHRSSQYRECVAHGGAGMLYVSQAPDNLVQIGTVTRTPSLGPIPSITIGADDGAAVREAIAGGATATAAMSVEAGVEPGQGRNVIGVLPGDDASGAYLLVGAHYDTWHVGSADNGTGVAALVELAEELASRGGRRYGVVFVGYDGEEIGLFGGYDYLRDHIVVAEEPALAFVNLEMPATGPEDIRAVAHTSQVELDEALQDANLRNLYPLYVGMDYVPEMFGGVIPTDIQGMYWSGVAGMSTACDSPYYHTVADTPDKIDVPFLASSVIAFEDALAAWDELDAAVFAERDLGLWSIEAATEETDAGLEVSIDLRDQDGDLPSDASVQVYVEVDDFTRVHSETVAAADGAATVTVPAAALEAGSSSRWLHILAGPDYPFAERVIPLD